MAGGEGKGVPGGERERSGGTQELLSGAPCDARRSVELLPPHGVRSHLHVATPECQRCGHALSGLLLAAEVDGRDRQPAAALDRRRKEVARGLQRAAARALIQARRHHNVHLGRTL